LSETDKQGSNAAAITTVGTEWHAAGREVWIINPPVGDANDSLIEFLARKRTA
jgi:hypothetical protein